MPPKKRAQQQEPEKPEETQPEQPQDAQPEEPDASDEVVEVEFGESPSETATLLLAAAEDVHGDQTIVRTTGTGTFLVPKSVADKAGLKPKE